MINAGKILKSEILVEKCRHSTVKSSKYSNIIETDLNLLRFPYLQFSRQGIKTGAMDVCEISRACGVPPARQIKLIRIFQRENLIGYIQSDLILFCLFPSRPVIKLRQPQLSQVFYWDHLLP